MYHTLLRYFLNKTQQIIVSGLLALALFSCHAQPASTQSSVQTNIPSFVGQLTPQDVAQYAKLGVKSIVNARPDGEGSNQPTNATMQTAAKNNNVTYAFIPVQSGNLTQQNILDFAAFYNTAPKPMVIFCRSGNRAQKLFEAAKAQGLIQ